MGSVTTTSTTYPGERARDQAAEPVAVGTIVWLGSEVMFFAGLFAIYFTLRSDVARAVGDETEPPEHPVRD